MFDATFQSTDLASVLATAQRMVSNKPTIPVLGNVLIKAEGEAIVVSATDTEIGFRAEIRGSAISPGEVTISARLLNELVRALPSTPVRLLAGGADTVTLTAAGFRGKLATLPPSDFPMLPVVPKKAPCVLPRVALRDSIARTRFAITEEDTRYYLNGAYLEPTEGAVRIVATDGHRLALCDTERVGPAGDAAILPKKTLDALSSMLENGSEDAVDYVRGENHLFFTVGSSVLISRVIDGKYPDYTKIIPKPSDSPAQIDRAAVLSMLKRIKTVADPVTSHVKFVIVPGALKVSAKSASVGDADEAVAANYQGPEVEVGLNVDYVMAFLDAAGTGSVAISITSPKAQVAFVTIGGAIDYRYVVMPVSLKE